MVRSTLHAPEVALRTLWDQLQEDREPEEDDEDLIGVNAWMFWWD
ncbi:hypothetical protein GCM10027059_22220 [Myceligenerans halotolerans]